MLHLQLFDVSKSFNNTPAVDNISLSLEQGQILCLLGPSGCGKSTLLRLIAGLETPDTGSIHFDGQNLAAIPPHRRDFGLMFQEFALFPHKNVGQNVSFGLEMKKETDIEARVREMLALVGLTGFEARDVSNLSGGERQRVALARSLAPNPRLLMLDEPLGALDRTLRERLMLEIRDILKQVGLTAIYVTHDQSEAFAVADRIVVMNRGRIEQEAIPEQLFNRPATPFVAKFLGFENLLPATCLANGQIETVLGVWPVAHTCSSGKQVIMLIRPEGASFEMAAEAIPVVGKLESLLFRGRFYQIMIRISGQDLAFEVPPANIPTAGSQITLWIKPASILLFPLNSM